MIDENQEVTIKWITRNKKKYESLGYHCEKLNTSLTIPLYQLDNNSNIHVTVNCDVCGKELITPYRNYNKIVANHGEYRCRKCNAPYVSEIRINNHKEKGLAYFNARITELGYCPTADIDDYKGHFAKLSFICPVHGEQQLSISQLQQGCICPECGKEARNKDRKLTQEDLFQIAKNKNVQILNPEEYQNYSTSNIRVTCCNCGAEHITSIASLSASTGYCYDCGLKQISNALKKSISDVKRDSTIDGVCYILNPEDYQDIQTKNLHFKCRTCGETYTRSLLHWKQGDGRCLSCIGKESIGENIISKVLMKYNIDFIREKRFKDCVNIRELPFDFYLPQYNCCIEFDGYHHYNEVRNREGNLSKVQYRDSIKTNYCKEQNIKLIRIPYWDRDRIEEIITNELGVFQLEDIV